MMVSWEEPPHNPVKLTSVPVVFILCLFNTFSNSRIFVFQWLVGHYLLLQLQYFYCISHADPNNYVHCRGLAVLHCTHQGKGCLSVKY